MGKSALGSSVLWVNFLSFLLILLALPEFVSVLPVGSIPWVALASAVVNAILRIFFTTQPIVSVLPQK